ncbi:unnamed protein product [Calypogeia fissa]
MLSSEEENSGLATRVAQEEMDQTVIPITHGKETLANQGILLHRKRKSLDALVHHFTLDTALLNNKRRRETFQPTGPRFRDPSHYKGGSNNVAGTGETLRKFDFNGSLHSSGISRSVSPRSPSTEGVKAITRRNALSGVHEATSAHGSGLANQSTVTTSSTEEEKESTSLHSFGQTSKVASETEDTGNLISSTQALGFGSIGRRQTGTHDHYEKRAKHSRLSHTPGNGRKPKIRDRQRDSEVLGPFSNIFAKLEAHDAEVDRVSGSILRDVIYAERSGKTETTCVLNSGCTSIEAGKRERARRATGYGCSIRQYDDSSELVHSTCSRELYSGSIGPGLCISSCSESIPSGLLTPYQPYRPMEPPRMKGSVAPPSQRNSVTVDEMMVTSGPFATEVTPVSSHAPSEAASSNASDQETESSSSHTTECKSSSVDVVRHIDSGLNTAPTFVLSSGRMSKDEAKRRGLRPSTIDDDFDQYFAQLML